MEILAVDQRIDAPQDNKMDAKELRSVTLLVNPADAARLNLGQNKGTLHLALRNHGDAETGAVEPATLAGLKAGSSEPPVVVRKPETAPPARVRKAPLVVRTLRGSTAGFVRFPPIEDDAEDSPTTAVLATAVKTTN